QSTSVSQRDCCPRLSSPSSSPRRPRAPTRLATRMRMLAVGRLAATVALLLAAGVRPVAAQEVSPEACADMEEQIRYLVNEGAFVQNAGLKEGVDLLANSILVRNAACGTPGDDSVPPTVAAT